MTSRERVRAALMHEEPDRVPIDFGGTKVTGIHVDEYVEIGRYLSIDLDYPKVYEQFQMLARVENDLIRKWLHTDIIELENPVETWGFRNEGWKPWKTTGGNNVLMPAQFNPVLDENGYLLIKNENEETIAYKAPTSGYFDRFCSTEISMEICKIDPKKWKESIALYTDEELNILQKRAEFLFTATDYSVHGGFLRGGLGTAGIFAGHTIGDWLMILATEKQYAYEILQATAEAAVSNVKLYLEAVGRYIDTILVSFTDFGTQNGELFNPETFKELHLPNYKLINDCIHLNSDAKVMFHSCGSIRKIIPCFIQAGVDILNPVQTSAFNMNPDGLKEEFGDDIVFWGGGIDTQNVLPFGTEQEIREQVEDRIRAFSKNGGFVFSPIHNLQYGVPPRNVEIMIETVLECGRKSVTSKERTSDSHD